MSFVFNATAIGFNATTFPTVYIVFKGKILAWKSTWKRNLN